VALLAYNARYLSAWAQGQQQPDEAVLGGAIHEVRI
jgi:hypothetical protein